MSHLEPVPGRVEIEPGVYEAIAERTIACCVRVAMPRGGLFSRGAARSPRARARLDGRGRLRLELEISVYDDEPVRQCARAARERVIEAMLREADEDPARVNVTVRTIVPLPEEVA